MNSPFLDIIREKMKDLPPLPKRDGFVEFTCPFCGGRAWRRKAGHELQGRCESRRCWKINMK